MVIILMDDNCDVWVPNCEPLLHKRDNTKIEIVQTDKSEAENTEKCRKNSGFLPVDLLWENISYTVSLGRKKVKKSILKDISGRVFPGELTAVMGPSGAGKTTLLNILSGYTHRNVKGQVLINGCSKNLYRNLSCYIMQDDVVLPHLTVKELITIAANLKLPGSITSKEKEKLVDDLIHTMGLTDCMHTKSNHISGGERKRLCIAQELVSNPPVIILDEPTSGLDSMSCVQSIKHLKYLADKGHTVICSIHQPSGNLLNFFDKLYVMSEGEFVYRGTVHDLLPYLSSYGYDCPQYHNPAEYVIEIASGSYGTSLEQLKDVIKKEGIPDRPPGKGIYNGNNNFSSDGISEIKKKMTSKQYASSSWTQFKVITLRSYKTICRDLLLSQLRFVTHIVFGLFMGLLYWKVGNDGSLVLKNSGYILFTTMIVIFTSMMPTVLTFPTERRVFLREQQNNWYRSYVYYIAKSSVDVPIQVVFTFVFCSITYWMTDQPSELFRFALFCVSCCLLSIVTQSVGIVAGSVAGVELAAFLAPASVLPMFLFNNFFLKLSDVTVYVRWLSYFSYFNYGYQIVMQAIYGYDRPDLKCPPDSACPFVNPKSFLESMNVEKSNVLHDILALVALCITIRIVGYILLLWTMRKKK